MNQVLGAVGGRVKVEMTVVKVTPLKQELAKRFLGCNKEKCRNNFLPRDI